MSTSGATTATPPSSPAGAQPTPQEPPTSPPYNLWFASIALGVALLAFLLTMLIFRDLFRDAQDAAIVTGALGALFTLIGTVAGAYFGIKRSSDTEDKGRVAEKAANESAREAHRSAEAALGALGSDKWEDLKARGLL